VVYSGNPIPRKSDCSQVFSSSSEGANYRTIDRTLPKLDAGKALMRLYDPESPFVLVDPTEMERTQAKKTHYENPLRGPSLRRREARLLDGSLR
jgi:hypothetical protein